MIEQRSLSAQSRAAPASALRASGRVLRSSLVLAGLRTDFVGWVNERRADPAFARFAVHLDVLAGVLGHMLDALTQVLRGLGDDDLPAGQVYQRCRVIDRQTEVVRRTFAFYREKYDQRANSRLAPTLLAADEIVRSCWSQAFAGANLAAPTGPLAFLDARFDAVAIARTSVPAELRGPVDSLVAGFIEQLPIPVIALPALCLDQPWWLIVAAHETGHHVQNDISPDLVARTRNALFTAISDGAGAPELAQDWYRWASESFADAFSVLMVGPSAAWAIEESQFSIPADLIKVPGATDRYPPPAVRSALLAEVAGAAGFADCGLGAAATRDWIGHLSGDEVDTGAAMAVCRHLEVTPVVARTLVDLDIDGRSLRQLCGTDPANQADGGRVAKWTERLKGGNPTFVGRQARDAARIAIAAGTQAFTTSGDLESDTRSRLSDNLITLLRSCGPAGTLAGAGNGLPGGGQFRADELTARLTQQLLTADGFQEV